MIPMTPPLIISGLPDDELVQRLQRFAHGSRLLLASFLAHLQEFDDRRLHEPRGFQSLFHYCTTELRLSADEAYLRIYAARLARSYPRILVMLARGELHLSGVSKLGPRLTLQNAEELLSQASGKSKRDIERICAPLMPRSFARDRIRFLTAPLRLPASAQQASLVCGPAATVEMGPTDAPIPALGRDVASETVAPAETVAISRKISDPESGVNPDKVLNQEAVVNTDTAVNPETVVKAEPFRGEEVPRYAVERGYPQTQERLVRITFIAAESLEVKIERAKALLRNKHPYGRLEDVFSEALDVLLAKKDPSARLAGARPPRRPSSRLGKRTRRVQKAVKDAVWLRDEGRCAFVSPEGRRCDAVEFLEYDHIKPWAAGGVSDDPANIRLLCRTHNALTARLIFGDRRNRRGDT